MLHSLDTLIGFAVVMSVVSLLIMIITQAVSAALGLRGRNLSDALEAMFRKIDPEINKHAENAAKNLADAVLTQPVISDSMLSMCKKWALRWKRASAIRPDELLQILGDIAERGTEQSKILRSAAASVLKGIGGTPNVSAATLSAATGNPALTNLEAWFNSAQDRAQQWFAMHTRMITIVASFAVAVVLQLDAVWLLQRVSSDPDVRARLLASVDAVQKQADRISQNADATDSATNKEIIAALQKKYPEIGARLNQPPNYPALADIDNWMRTQLNGEQKSEEIVTDFNQFFFQRRLESSSKALAEVSKNLDKTGLQLLPSPYPRVFNRNPERKSWQIFSGEWSWPKQHLLGILVSAALLSLGAPFWFNALKSLTNLRPLLAREVEKDPKQIPQQLAK